MREIELSQQFNAVIAWHSLFHLDFDNQRKMFAKFKAYTKPKGILVFTSGIKHSEEWSKNGGEVIYHASLSTDEYKELLATYSFKILIHKQQDPNCGNALFG